MIRRILPCLLMGLLSVSHAQATESDERLCKMYRERLQKYQKEGVMGINVITGRTQKMDARQAREVMEQTRENIRIFCNPSGVVR